MTGAISSPIEGSLTIQRNSNMLKNSKNVSSCRFYRFLCKNVVPRLSTERTFVLRRNLAKTYILSTYEGYETLCVGK